jgi:hypothetical protein
MKYPFHIVDVFSSTPFGGNQLAVLPDATGISTEGMQKIAREFNFGETAFVLPKNDPANTCRVRIFSPRTELDFAGHPSVRSARALMMKQHVRLSDPIRLILEENVGPVTVDVAERNGGFHGMLTLSGKIDAPTGAPSPTDLAAILSVEPAEVSQVFFAGVEEAPATGAPVLPSSVRWHRSPSLAGRPIAFRSNKVSRWGAEAKSKRRRVRAERPDLCQRWWCHGLHCQRRNRRAAVRAGVIDRRLSLMRANRSYRNFESSPNACVIRRLEPWE